MRPPPYVPRRSLRLSRTLVASFISAFYYWSILDFRTNPILVTAFGEEAISSVEPFFEAAVVAECS